MDLDLQPGVKNQVQWTVTEQHTAQHIGSGRVPVFATPAMILLLETAAQEGVQPFLPEGLTTVGVHLDVKHLAPTPVGMKVTGRAELIRVDGRILTFRVTAEDEVEPIGEGTHQRAVIDVARFQKRVEAKAGARP
jgi:fluoroacetyl-CoA thioesterase